MLKNTNFLFCLKIALIGIILMLSCFKQYGMHYFYIYGLFSLVYFIQMVSSTLACCLSHIWSPIFRFCGTYALRDLNRQFQEAIEVFLYQKLDCLHQVGWNYEMSKITLQDFEQIIFNLGCICSSVWMHPTLL